MPREMPSTVELVRQMVALDTNTDSETGRHGFIDLCNYIRDLVEGLGLGNVMIQKFQPTDPSGDLEPTLQNLFIDIGDGPEMGIWHGHADSISYSDIYAGSTRDPLNLTQSTRNPDIYKAVKSYDMIAGIAAFLRALPGLESILKKVNRRVRIAIVTREEKYSEGTYSAEPHLKDGKWAISTEIPVGGKLSDEPAIYHGRAANASFIVKLTGTTKHLGAADPSNRDYLIRRFPAAWSAIKKIKLPEPDGFPGVLLPQSKCMPNGGSVIKPNSMTACYESTIIVEAIYTNNLLEVPDIENRIRIQLIKRLGSEEGLIVETIRDRPTPHIGPWLEDPSHPLVMRAKKVASALFKRDVPGKIACATADEGILSNWGIPVVTFPPRGEGEHTAHECVDIPYIDRYVVPFLQGMAGCEEPLVQGAERRTEP